MSVLTSLLTRGFFPKELPPAFTTESFAVYITTPPALFDPTNCLVAPKSNGTLVHARSGYSRLCRHNLARPDGTTRPLQIPHPVQFYYLCKELHDKWAEVDAHLQKSDLSISTPKIDPAGSRAYVPTQSGAARPRRRMLDRAQGNYLLTTDIANFYGTVYTHSLPWALHTKAIAKTNRNDMSLLGNALDTYIRNGQDGQTLGIPVGTDTSFIIAELLMASVDNELQARCPNVKGFRFYDDYEFVCQDESSAQSILAALDDCVSEYELALNRRKTKIVKLPETIEHQWVTTLRLFNLPRFSEGAEENLIDFANIVFPLSKKYPNDPVLRYALVKLATGKVEEDLAHDPLLTEADLWHPYASGDIYQRFLIQAYRAEPHLSHIVAGELLRYQLSGGLLNLDLLEGAISAHIMQYAANNASNEIAWALWLAIQLNITLSDEVADKVSSVTDNFVAILALDAQDKKLFKKKLDTATWESLLAADEIYSENWLLCYEAAARGWLSINDGSNYINTHPCFGIFHGNSIRFYDENSYSNTTAILERLKINAELYVE